MAGEVLDGAAQAQGRAAQGAVRGAGEDLVEERRGALFAAAEPGGAGGGEQSPQAQLALRGQPRGPLVRRRGGRVAGALGGQLGRRGERRRRLLVGPDRGAGQVPGALLGLGRVGQRGGQRPVRGADVGGRRGAVDRRADQRMAELELGIGDRDQAGVLSRLELGAAQRRGGAQDRLDPAAGCRGGDQQSGPGRGRQPLGPAGEAALDARPGRQRRGQRLLAAALGRAEQRRQLADRQRVATGRRPQPAGHLGIDGALAAARDQARGRLRPEPAERQPLHPLGLEGPQLPLAGGEQQRHPVGPDPPRREEQRVLRGPVKPVGVVDDRQQRPLLGGGGQQAERRGADGEAIALARLTEPEGAGERPRLPLGDLPEPIEQRPADVVQAGELELGLGLDTTGTDDGHPLRPRGGVVEQRRLADPRLAAQQQGAAALGAGGGEQLLDPLPLGLAANQHRPKLSRPGAAD